jgi:hypothetical protein
MMITDSAITSVSVQSLLARLVVTCVRSGVGPRYPFTSSGFLMNKIPFHPSSCDFESTAIARVCLAVAKTNVEAAWPCRNRENTTGADLNRSPWTFLSLVLRPPRRCILLQSP